MDVFYYQQENGDDLWCFTHGMPETLSGNQAYTYKPLISTEQQQSYRISAEIKVWSACKTQVYGSHLFDIKL